MTPTRTFWLVAVDLVEEHGNVGRDPAVGQRVLGTQFDRVHLFFVEGCKPGANGGGAVEAARLVA